MKPKSIFAILLLSLALWLGLIAVTPQTSSAAVPAENTVLATFTLPDLRLGAFQNALLPGSITNDRNIFLGGIGSDFWKGPKDPPNEFWMQNDQGPAQAVTGGRIFPVPGYDPTILHVRVQNGSINILKAIPIVTASGKPVTGIPNISPTIPGGDYFAFNLDGSKQPFNPNGIDTEGVVHASGGDFWVVEEYRPSLLHISPTGRVIKRFVPPGVALTGTDYPVVASLPPIFSKRKPDRGFEGVTLSHDEKTLYIVLQSPLHNPTPAIGNASRNTRVLVFDIATENVTAEYVYRFEDVRDFTFNTKTDPAEMKLSALVFYNHTTLFIEERTDLIAKLYSVDLNDDKATNILGSKWDNPATSPSLEALADPATQGVRVLPKTLLIDLSQLPGIPERMEGVAIIDNKTIAVANDNHFDCCNFDSAGNNVGVGLKSKILIIGLADPLHK
jgi:phytase-like protein